MRSKSSKGATVLVALALALALALLGTIAPPTVQAGSLPKLLTQLPNRPFQVRPPLVSYTGDGTAYLAGPRSKPGQVHRGGIHWTVYNARHGFGKATNWLNSCSPDCADGHFSPHRATVQVRRVRSGHFTRMTIHFFYNGRWRYDHRALGGSGGYAYWDICGTSYSQPC